MYCLKCKNPDTKVIDSRVTDDGKSIRRRRECEKCGSRFTTFEKMEFTNFLVSKSDGNKELYDREKVKKSIYLTCNKRDIDPEIIDTMISDLESQWGGNKKGVTSKRIGKDILCELKKIDKVAFIRYASVYHNFETPEDFVEFINENKNTSCK
ncbi:MAG: transcriptional regulator NrdR [Candidatus Gracilibacteria bacterium]|nr:transcriptional regulator NrdR [Candidatus Gracilibacteria bacterium]